MANLKGKVIIVTGAAMGLGLAAVEVLAEKGANITLVDFNEEALKTAKADLEKYISRQRIFNRCN